MPGLILDVEGTKILGCAWHPRFSAYEPLVHVVVGPTIVRSLFASERLQRQDLPEEGVGHGFTVNVAPFGVAASAMDSVKLLIGETDEWLELPPAEDRDADAEITVEEIIGAPFRRKWVTGKIYFDAQLAGLSTETIIDLLYRDYLGRPSDPEGLAHYSARIKAGALSFGGFRRVLVNAQEYTLRRWRAAEAPGAIFSQCIVLRAGNELAPEKEGKKPKEITVSLRPLFALDGLDFVLEAGRQLLGKPPVSPAVWRHIGELRAGRRKLDIIRELCGQPAALARNLRLVDPVEEEATPAPAARRRRQRLQVIAGSGGAPRGKARESAAVFVPLIELLRRDGARFVTEAYRRILGRQPSAGEAAFWASVLAAGGKKRDILRFLAGEPEAAARDVRIVERPDLAQKPGGLAAATGKEEAAAARLAATPAPAAMPVDVVGFSEPDEAAPEPLLGDQTAAPEEAESGKKARSDGVSDADSGEAEPAATVILSETLGLEDREFVIEAYRRILGTTPDDEVVALQLAEIASGRDKSEFVRTLAADVAAGARGVRLIEDAEEAAALAAEGEEGAFEEDAAEAEELFFARAADRAAAPAEAADGEEYRPFGDPNSLEGPLVGTGFHPAETNGAGWWRWTGPGRRAQIRLSVPRPGSYRVAIWCERAPAGVLEGFLVRCCGEEAPMLVSAQDGAASIVCDAWAPEAGFAGWMDLELQHGPPEPDADGRLLGLCIGSIRVEGSVCRPAGSNR